MRIPLAIVCLTISTSFALAQETRAPISIINQGATTEKQVIPKKTGQQQPQGKTGPLETEGKSAPPDSPQGDTPPGMQADPTTSN